MTEKHELIEKEKEQFFSSFKAFVQEQCERFGVCPIDIELELIKVLLRTGEYLK